MNCQPYAQRPARLGIDGRVDAHQPACRIDQGAARITRIDGRVGLNEVFVNIDTQPITPQGRHDAHGGGLPDAEGVAEDRKSTRLNSSYLCAYRLPSSSCKNQKYTFKH